MVNLIEDVVSSSAIVVIGAQNVERKNERSVSKGIGKIKEKEDSLAMF